MKDLKNNRKLSASFSYIFQSIFVSSDSFCLITSYMNLTHLNPTQPWLFGKCALKLRVYMLRARSQILVVGLTGHALAWPSALKLPGAVVKQTYKYRTPERQCVMCVTNFWISIISIHTSRFGSHCYSYMGTYSWNILYSKILPAKSRTRRRRPAAQSGRTPEFGYGP